MLPQSALEAFTAGAATSLSRSHSFPTLLRVDFKYNIANLWVLGPDADSLQGGRGLKIASLIILCVYFKS